MGLSHYKLGYFLEEIFRKNMDGKYGVESVRGISNAKEIMPTKAKVTKNVLPKFYVIYPDEFIYNPRTTRMGDKIGLAINNTKQPLLFSFNNLAFRVKDNLKSILSPEYLFMYFNRKEFDRYARINSWGSATELFSFSDLCDMEITLPDISIQRKYVAIYKSLQDNLAAYQSNLDDLKLTCDAYVEKLRHTVEPVKIGDYIEEVDERNTLGLGKDKVVGISTQKVLIETKANLSNVNLANYKILESGFIGYIADTSRRGNKMSLALNTSDEDFLVSSITTVFKTNEHLLAEYLMLFFCRSEFDRYARFNSWGSARETIEWEDMCNVKIPIPKLDIQESIVKIFKVYNERKKIAEKLKQQLSDICPILIKGALEEGGAYGKEK